MEISEFICSLVICTNFKSSITCCQHLKASWNANARCFIALNPFTLQYLMSYSAPSHLIPSCPICPRPIPSHHTASHCVTLHFIGWYIIQYLFAIIVLETYCYYPFLTLLLDVLYQAYVCYSNLFWSPPPLTHSPDCL